MNINEFVDSSGYEKLTDHEIGVTRVNGAFQFACHSFARAIEDVVLVKMIDSNMIDNIVNECIDVISVNTNGFVSNEESIIRNNCVLALRKKFNVSPRQSD